MLVLIIVLVAGLAVIASIVNKGKNADGLTEEQEFRMSKDPERSIKEHFSYDDKCVWDKASQLYVSLPVDKAGCPDWAYMDAFMSTALRECESALTSIKEIG